MSPALAALRDDLIVGEITDRTEFAPGLALLADPALGARGSWRSPAGRLLELDIATAGRGDWIALHLTLDLPDLTPLTYFGFACTGVAPQAHVIHPCLRSGGPEGGFSDAFFDRHILTRTDPVAHVDALHLPTRRRVPPLAPWRELVLFLPTVSLCWHLHDLRVFTA
ncbi:hypothetical protein [Sedimentitalea nanhaiensis]|uniref:Uncharacterized protein n=1 Tax=Sedimentitalea nanhaiensis TaxID=999627 RepID=A0A1I7EBN3_9RHOB|nr:hypothetical protein [Sedimentitalea nanhaiensis]SFU21338.1 hypothetical protein SAMN05216236_16012 [Sedimentitalea nanhaiensis]